MDYVSFVEARQALERGETSCEVLVSSFLQQIRLRNEVVNAFLSVEEEPALEAARDVDRRFRSGTELPLAGMVMGIKDVICMKGGQVTCGSHILEGFRSLYDATVIHRLQQAGAVIVGKTNCDEFAMGSSTENSYFGPVRNPDFPEYVPGGSSGGSAAAVAARMCHTALGSDTGGSIRQPAAFCGVVGLKPTYGRVSRYGLVAYASSFDSIGPFGHSVEDVASVLGVIAGSDPSDSTSAPVAVPDYRTALTGSIRGLKIGLPREYYADGLDPEIRKAIDVQVEQLGREGAEFVEVSLPYTEYGIATYYILVTAEASSNLARYDGVRYGYRANMDRERRALLEEKRELESELLRARSNGDTARVAGIQERLEAQHSLLYRMYTASRTEGFGKEVKRRIMLGTYVLSAGYYEAYYGKAQRVRALIRQDFDRVFKEVDLLLTPATPTPAFKIGSIIDDPLEMYLNDVYTVTANLAGIPGLVVPIGTHPEAPGLPVGMQFLGPHFGEEVLLRAGDVAFRVARESVAV